MKNKYSIWKFNKKIINTEDYKLNNKIAEKSSKRGFNEICKRYTHIHYKNLEKMIKLDTQIYKQFKGTGVDLGGGIGLFSSIIAKKKEVMKIFCVEIVKKVVSICHPIVKKKILKKDYNKVHSVVGDFNKLNLKNNSIDFCIAWDSLHHSTNIVKTLKEAKRVLKKKGKMIIFDRGHNNETTNEEIDRMLNVIYPKKFLKENHLPLKKILTRKMNGEHEYRFFEWEYFFRKSKLKIIKRLIIKENNLKNIKNKQGIIEKKVGFKIGGFERKKIAYVLQK